MQDEPTKRTCPARKWTKRAGIIAFFFFLGKWVFDILYFVGEQRVHGFELVQQLLLWSPLSAAVTAAVGVLLLFIMRPLLEPSPA